MDEGTAQAIRAKRKPEGLPRETEAEGAEGAREGAKGKGRGTSLAKPLPIDDGTSHTRATGEAGGTASPTA